MANKRGTKRTKPYHNIWDKVKKDGQALVAIPNGSNVQTLKKALSNIKLYDVSFEYDCIKQHGETLMLAYEWDIEMQVLRVFTKPKNSKAIIDI